MIADDEINGCWRLEKELIGLHYGKEIFFYKLVSVRIWFTGIKSRGNLN